VKRTRSALMLLLLSLSAAAQTGGGFNLQQNVIGDGGWRSDGAGFTVLGTMGQGNAGSATANGQFHLLDGLWATENQSASSPFATVTGKVVNRRGAGIPRVLVTINNPQTNLSQEVWTEAHGLYSFANIPTGGNYVITVNHQHFAFNPDSQSLFISQDRCNVDFVSDGN
jgi:hypothetical protein